MHDSVSERRKAKTRQKGRAGVSLPECGKMAWYDEAFFYHIYPLGLCGAPKTNSYGKEEHRLRELHSRPSQFLRNEGIKFQRLSKRLASYALLLQDLRLPKLTHMAGKKVEYKRKVSAIPHLPSKQHERLPGKSEQ